MSNAKNFDILSTNLNSYLIIFIPNIIIFRSISSKIFRYFSKIVLSVQFLWKATIVQQFKIVTLKNRSQQRYCCRIQRFVGSP